MLTNRNSEGFYRIETSDLDLDLDQVSFKTNFWVIFRLPKTQLDSFLPKVYPVDEDITISRSRLVDQATSSGAAGLTMSFQASLAVHLIESDLFADLNGVE